MEKYIFVLFLLGMIMLIAGIIMSVLATISVQKGKAMIAILFTIFSCPCIYIPLKFTIGLQFAKSVKTILLVYCIIIIVWSVKNIMKKDGSNSL